VLIDLSVMLLSVTCDLCLLYCDCSDYCQVSGVATVGDAYRFHRPVCGVALSDTHHILRITLVIKY
jgi:hypothetical protein